MNKILDYLENSMKKHPDKPAYGDINVTLTYSEVYGLSRSIGTALIGTGAVLRPIMIMMDKTPYTLTAFFGVLYSRNFYVPIDVDMPGDRLAKIVGNLSPEYIICDDANEEKALLYLSRERVLNYSNLASVDPDEPALSRVRRTMLDVDPMYIIYTSGTTGVPKGVVIPQRALSDYIDNFTKEFCIGEDDVIGDQVPFYFDMSLIDIYCTLKNGGTMFIIPHTYFTLPLKLIEFMNEYHITAIRWVPSALKMVYVFNVFSEIKPEYLKTVVFGGESMPTKCYNYWKKNLPHVTFIQNYGPTEITGICVYHYVTREFDDSETIPIGKPLDNSGVMLIDEQDNVITGEGEIGEICIYGSCLSLGYYNMPEKTAEVFTQFPGLSSYGQKIYRSGDLAKYNEYGELVFVGRKDYQIKHMGFRIELGEIESAANTVPGVVDCACIFDEKKDKIIICYITDSGLEKKEFETVLKTKISGYMMPEKYIALDELPKSKNGKINRLKLREMFIK